MKNKKLLTACAVICVAAILAGCVPSKPVTSGSFAGTTYTNDTFGLSFAVTDSWKIASKDDMAKLFSVDVSAVGSDDKEAEKAMNLNKQKELYLAAVSLLGDDGQESGASMSLIGENLSLYGAVVKTGKSYCEAAIDDLKKAYDSMGVEYTIGDITETKINGTDFAYMNNTLTGSYEGTSYEYYQRTLCTVKNNYALVFTMTWFDDTQLAALQGVVDTISFK